MTLLTEERCADLMRRSLGGDRAAYAELLKDVRQWLTAYYRKRVPLSTVEDMVQDTLISLHEKRATWQTDRPFLPWLAAIARYKWIDYMRKVTRRGEVLVDDFELEQTRDSDVTAKLDVDKMLKTLPEKQARTIRLVKIEDHSIEDAAALTNQSVSAVKVAIHRGLKKLAAFKK